MRRVMAALLAAAVVAAGSAAIAKHVYQSPGPLKEQRAIVLPRGGIEQVASLLAHDGVVPNPTFLRAAAFLTRGQGPVHSGELTFPANASLQAVLAVLRFGKPVQHRLTIPEGLTAAQVATILDRAATLDGDTPIPDEGGFLPETYAYEVGVTRAGMVERGHKAMDQALQHAWANRAPESAPLASPRDALVLASIVERETGRTEERPRIAGVFLNRLRRGMKLQSDPTVVYAASGGLGVLDHGLTRAELERDDPYNTYRITGLPPGPICMPGLPALHAVTQPQTSDDLYFVADGLGGHLFAKTEQDHFRNVARWRTIERQRLAMPKPNQN